MQDKTYVITEIVGVSDNSIDQAVANAIARANQTLKVWARCISLRKRHTLAYRSRHATSCFALPGPGRKRITAVRRGRVGSLRY